MKLNIFKSPSAGCVPVLGMTLPEMMVAMLIGSVVLTIMATVFVSSARSFAATGNYVAMDVNSRMALDSLSREIRQAGNLVEFNPARLKFTKYPQTNSFVVYSWDPASRQLVGSSSDDPATRVFLTGCDQLAFSLYDSAFGPTTNLSESKGVCVSWKCSRTVLNTQNTEDMQQAMIIMRNKKL